MGGAGDDLVNTSTATSFTHHFRQGSDTINILGDTSSRAVYSGEDDADFVFATAARTLLNSTLYGGKGNDTISMFSGVASTVTNSFVGAGVGGDSINLGTGTITTSTIKGGDGADTIDLLQVNATTNAVSGNKGADTMQIGAGSTTTSVYAGAGHDTVSVLTAGTVGTSSSVLVTTPSLLAVVQPLAPLLVVVFLHHLWRFLRWCDLWRRLGVTTAGTGTGGLLTAVMSSAALLRLTPHHYLWCWRC